jgi:hypothetical protein
MITQLSGKQTSFLDILEHFDFFSGTRVKRLRPDFLKTGSKYPQSTFGITGLRRLQLSEHQSRPPEMQIFPKPCGENARKMEYRQI